MKRQMQTLMAGSLIALSGGALAQSSVTVSGLIDAAVVSDKVGDTRVSRLDSGNMSTSFLQFSGSEDLGGGLKAKFTLGSFFRNDTGDSGRYTGDMMWARDANVALEGGFGSVVLGRQINPYFLATITQNPFGDSFGFSPIVRSTFTGISIANTNSGYSNAVSYSTPSYGGLNGTVTYSFSEIKNQDPTIGADVLYGSGPFTAALGYEDTNTLSGATLLHQVTLQAGATYDFSVLKLYGQIQRTRDVFNKYRIHQLGISVPAGAGSFLLSYAKTSVIDRKILSFGYDYNLSKRTDLYAIYMQDKVPVLKENEIAFGIRHKF